MPSRCIGLFMSTNYSMEFPRISKQSINKETFERLNYNDSLSEISNQILLVQFLLIILEKFERKTKYTLA